MNLRGMEIGTQLRLGLGAILLLVIGLASLSWMQTDQLWLQTEGIYSHPLQVRRAIGKLESSVESVSRHVRDLFLSANDDDFRRILGELDKLDVGVDEQLTVLFDRYLGPHYDLTALQGELQKWNALRKETVDLLREGKKADAAERLRPGGTQDRQRCVVWERLGKIDEFARQKGDQFYQEASERRAQLQRTLAVIGIVILALTLAVSALLVAGIRRPLAALTQAAQSFRAGRLDVRCASLSENEFRVLTDSFNEMAQSIESEMQVRLCEAELADVMMREMDVRTFCHALLKFLLKHTRAQVGAVYLLNDEKTAFELAGAIGLTEGARRGFSVATPEGEFGAALATRQIQHVTNISAETRFTFSAVCGSLVPREILTVPVQSSQEVTAVISLASVGSFSAQALQIVAEVLGGVTARLSGVLAFRKVQELAGRLAAQNQELDVQKRELESQAKELEKQNAELDSQKRQLDEASRLKSAFLSNMSHELRTPLNSVIALSGVLRRRLSETISGEERNYLEVIERNGKILLTLINDILDLSRVEAGGEQVVVEPFSPRELADQVVDMLSQQAQERGLTLSNRVEADLPLVNSDVDKCRRIILNLLGNAVKFTHQGSVEISSKRLADGLLLIVRDTGIGIASDHIPYIFEEFRQADEGTSRKYGGTGLGLAIAKRYAELLGGGIAVESELGKGSVFTVRLPWSLPGRAPSALPSTATAVGFVARESGAPQLSRGDGHRILLVEDNEPAIIQLLDILQAEGYEVDVARCGKAALEQVGRVVPDAMILDLMMPEVDGFEVLKTIREISHTARLPVLILTAKHVTKDELSFLKSNHVHQLIQKGDIDREGLLKAVAGLFAPAPAADGARPPVARRVIHARKPLVLVVEDNPDNLLTACALLKDNCVVLGACDGRAGLSQAQARDPDIILTDIALPVMDGYALLDAVRREGVRRDVPVIAVTASAMKGQREAILARGFDGYISKPISPESLMLAMRTFLEWDGAS